MLPEQQNLGVHQVLRSNLLISNDKEEAIDDGSSLCQFRRLSRSECIMDGGFKSLS